MDIQNIVLHNKANVVATGNVLLLYLPFLHAKERIRVLCLFECNANQINKKADSFEYYKM